MSATDMAPQERERNRVFAIGYAHGRIEAGDTRIDIDQVPAFGAFCVASGATWMTTPKAFEQYVHEQEMTS